MPSSDLRVMLGVCNTPLRNMASIVFLWVGRLSDSEFFEKASDYLKRIERYYPTSQIVVPDSKHKTSKKEEEGKQILEKLKDGDFVILCDETGKSLTTPQFSKNLESSFLKAKRTVFIVGGAYGVSDAVKKRSNQTLNLSTLTFPHELARVVLVEQVYRACTLLKGEKYHH